MSPKEYAESVLEIIENNSIRAMDLEYSHYTKPALNFANYRAKMMASFRENPPPSIDDVKMTDFIITAIQELDDGHSHLIESDAVDHSPFEDRHDALHTQIIGNTAYMLIPRELVPWEQAPNFAALIREKIIDLDSQNLDGWVIDLRASYGGGMWATLAALWPFMPQDQPAGYFLKPGQDPAPWGPLPENNDIINPPYKIKNENRPIAVITGKNTSSAGDALALSFREIPNVKSFGQPTDGRSTGNTTFELPDGREIAVATSIMADRRMTPYGGKITPDQIVASPYDRLFDGNPVFSQGFDPEKDPTVQTTRQWIAEYNTQKPQPIPEI